MSRTRPLVIVLLSLIAVACAYAPKDEDDAYLEGFCEASLDYSNQLTVADDAEAVVATIGQFRDALAALTPASDVEEFHASYIAYLGDIAANPGIDADPPELPADVARRLDGIAGSVDACRETDFFSP